MVSIVSGYIAMGKSSAVNLSFVVLDQWEKRKKKTNARTKPEPYNYYLLPYAYTVQ